MTRTYLIAACLALLLAAGEPAEAAPGGLSDYTWKSASGNTCTGKKIDPINVVWIDQSVTTVRNRLQSRLRWGSVGGGYQYTGSNGKCTG